MSEEVIDKLIYTETEFDLGNEALENKQYHSAIEHFEKGAKNGDERCAAKLGEAYYLEAKSVVAYCANRECEKRELYERAAELGYPSAQYEIGECYRLGRLCCVDDLDSAMAWYTKAAENGNAAAQNTLGWLYLWHFKEKTTAFEWLTRAAAQEHREAMYELGVMYYYGNGTKKDYDKAFELFSKLVEYDYDRAWYIRDNAKFMLGKCYFNGYGVEKDRYKADKCFFDAVHRNRDYMSNREAAFYLAVCRIESACGLIQYQAERNIKYSLEYLYFAIDGEYGRRARAAYHKLKKQYDDKDFDKEYWRKWCEKQT